MESKGLLIDYQWCTGCHTCEVACQMVKGLPEGKFGIKISELGPWKKDDGKWQLDYVPVPTDHCDLCADRVELGEVPSCVKHCQSFCMYYGSESELMELAKGKKKQALFLIA